MPRVISLFFLITVGLVTLALGQRERFIQVDGADLKAKMEAALKQGRAASPAGPFWLAYSFDVRSGVAVDADLSEFSGTTNTFAGVSVAIGRTAGVTVETRNLGVFILHDPAVGDIRRVEVYNLDRRREYSGYPVYWLGRANNEESLNYLKDLIEAEPSTRLREAAVVALALHDDRRVVASLADFIRRLPEHRVRATAVFWLGQVDGANPLLAELIRNERENTEVRKQAAFALGASKDKNALATLQNLYGAVSHREVKKQLVFAAAINDNQEAANNFLIKLAQTETEREVRKQAIFWLGQKASQRSLEALGDLANGTAETEVQKQAVFALSQRRKEEAVPMLIQIAKTHPKAAVRKQALFWLGQSGDERAIELFVDILKK